MRIWNYISQAFLAPHSLTSPPATTSDALSPHPASMANKNTTIYFGYGSNLWRHQMQQRCPHSEYLGVARLNNYTWLINERGYANVVEISHHQPNSDETGSYENEVWGLVYSLQPSDEKRLDRNEGVPFAYTKELLSCDFWPGDDKTGPANITAEPEWKGMLVYINRDQVEPSRPKEEYVYRMNMGIRDAIKEGVPRGYVEKVMRRFIPERTDGDGVEAERVARRQAVKFEDER